MNKLTKHVSDVTVFGIGAGREGQSTTHFMGVTRFEESETKIEIDYVSDNTNITRTVRFFINNISGYATTVAESK